MPCNCSPPCYCQGSTSGCRCVLNQCACAYEHLPNDSPNNIRERRAVLKDYDNKRGPKSK